MQEVEKAGLCKEIQGAVNCPCCDGSVVLSLGDDSLRFCKVCSHIWQNPLEVGVVYDKKYVKDRYDSYDTTSEMSHLRLGLVAAYLTHRPINEIKLLDVGFGNGDFLRLAEKYGVKSYGYDVHECYEDYGVTPGSLDDVYDVVTFFDSLEHFPDIRVIRPVISKAKVVVTSIPCRPPAPWPYINNGEGLEFKPAWWRHYRPGEHLHYFNEQSLSNIVRKPLIFFSNLEDVIRTPQEEVSFNVGTYVFSGYCS